MADERPVALIRCMGGGFCRHTPGTCTATQPGPGPVLGTRIRGPEPDVEAIAYGLYELDAPLGTSLRRGWDRLTTERRDLYLARARLLLSGADQYDPDWRTG